MKLPLTHSNITKRKVVGCSVFNELEVCLIPYVETTFTAVDDFHYMNENNNLLIVINNCFFVYRFPM